MKKTAMQLLIEDIEKHDQYFLEHGSADSPVKRIHKKATELLETEREQIEDAYRRGKYDEFHGESVSKVQYYKETYG